jgi:hypothetical protein
MAKNSRKLNKATLIAALAASCVSAPAWAKKQITPYIQVDQVVTADLNNGGDVLTYTSVSAGIDASVSNSRSEFQISYRYERRFDYQKNVGDQDVHTGLARGRIDLVPNLLSFEAGAIATQARSDIRGAAPTLLVGNVDNVTQVYSVYAGPSLATHVGPVDVTAAYRAGYTKVDSVSRDSIPTGQPILDQYDDSISHFATASVGMESGVLPFGWTVSGAYEREDAGQLDQRFEGKHVRGDIIVPVTPTVAVVGGVGYESIKSSQRDALLDIGGAPVLGTDGRFQTDPASPRRIAYNEDGLFWDAGVMWRPSSRTALEARVGRRYGSMSYTGSFTWAATQHSNFAVGVYDSVESFGQQLNDNLSNLPTSFRTSRNNLANNVSGCVFGQAVAGGCLNDAFQAINTSAYRSRGVTAVWSASRGAMTAGLGVGYNQRKFFAPTQAGVFSVNGLSDESYYVQGNVEYVLSPNSTITGDVYASLYSSGISGADNVLATGATGAYLHNFGRNLSASATVGLYSFKQDTFNKSLTASATAGLRYSF